VFRRRLQRWQFALSDRGLDSDVAETHTWDPADDHLYFHNTTDQARDVVRRVAAGEPPATPAADALETMLVCEAAERSADQHRPVPVDELRDELSAG
jgi:predicted dehydrogenase